MRAVRVELATPGRYHLHPQHVQQHRTWLQAVFSWIGDEIAKIAQAITSHVHLGATGAHLLGDALLLGTMLAIASAIAWLLTSLQIDGDRFGDAHSLFPARNAQALARTAATFAAIGDYARAIRALFAAATVLLDLRGVVADDESATINELRRELRARRSDAELPFTEIARVYTTAAYAECAVDEAAWLQALDAYARLGGSTP